MLDRATDQRTCMSVAACQNKWRKDMAVDFREATLEPLLAIGYNPPRSTVWIELNHQT